MPVFRLTDEIVFPDPRLADESGLLAVGGGLEPARLELAYRLGIFPWYDAGLPILWHSPDPRCVLPLEGLVVSRSLKKALRRFEVRFDTDFEQVIDACATVPREGQDGTWITSEMRAAYVRLHEEGLAHSVEAWQGDTLAGGLYGVAIGRAFFGESMFHRASDASKVALVRLVERLRANGFELLDCQVPTPHLMSLGAELWPRDRFLGALDEAVSGPIERRRWNDEAPATP